MNRSSQRREEDLPTPSKNQHEETLLEAFASICGVLVVGLFVLTFIFQNFAIPSSSMEKTLLIGDHVLVDRITLAPPAHWAPFVYYRDVHRGDIIVFYKPTLESNGEHLFLVKRVVGIPGDHIHLRDGVVYRNGVALTEPYINSPPADPEYSPYRDDFPAVPPSEGVDITAEWAEALPSYVQNGDLVVPPGKYFVMGDNRTVSLDSRYWGFVPKQDIIGRPLFVYWSFKTPEDQVNKTSLQGRAAFAFHVITHFFSDTRWNRAFHILS